MKSKYTKTATPLIIRNELRETKSMAEETIRVKIVAGPLIHALCLVWPLIQATQHSTYTIQDLI